MASTALPHGAEPPAGAQIKKYSIHGYSEIHTRRDIVEWYKSTDELDVKSWHLFVKALQIFQGKPESDYLSYYQIAGIHGAPFTQWNEHPQPGDMPGNYCTHGTALFLPWHAPYHLLFEQELVKLAIEHAESFSDKYKKEYVAAARQIRAPYWDFVANHVLPDPIREPRCKIKLPQPGSDDPPQEIEGHNPLYSYQFQDTTRRHRNFAVSNGEWRRATETLRCPPRGDKMTSQPDIVDRQLGTPNAPGARLPTNFRSGVYTLLMHVDHFAAFSNTGWRGPRPPVPDTSQDFHSLEGYHNSVHVYTGTDMTPEIDPGTGRPVIPSRPVRPGHMVDTASAAFDPIFWLLHGNIDRIYALWQAIHYESEFQEQNVETTRLPHARTAQDSHASELRPFYIRNKENPDAHNTVWVANMVQRGGGQVPSRFDYGFTYPEIPQSMKGDPSKDIAAHVRAEVCKLYRPPNETFHKPEHYPKEFEELEHRDAIDFRREWNVVFKVKRSLISHNFTIFFFLGDPGEEPCQWSTHNSLLGSFSTFKGQGDYCTNCASQEAADLYMKGAIDITEGIYTKLPEIRSDANLDCTKEIAALLNKHLTWRVMNHETGQGINLESILRADREALKVLPTSFLEPFLKSSFDDKALEDLYSGFGEKLVLTQHEKYVNREKRDAGWWVDDD